MTGRLIAKGGDRWELVVDAGRDPLTGRRKRKSLTFRGSQRQAEKRLTMWAAEVMGDRPTTDATVAQLLTEYMAMKPDLALRTRDEYQRLIDQRIVPALGHVRVRKLTAGDLDRFYRALGKGGAS